MIKYNYFVKIWTNPIKYAILKTNLFYQFELQVSISHSFFERPENFINNLVHS